MILRLFGIIGIATGLLLVSCRDQSPKNEASSGGLFQIGDSIVTEEVLELWIKERSTSGAKVSAAQREALKKELIQLVQLAELAKKRELDLTPEARVSQWRSLASTARNDLRENLIKEVTEDDLRALFESDTRFQELPEKRKVAVLWLPAEEKS